MHLQNNKKSNQWHFGSLHFYKASYSAESIWIRGSNSHNREGRRLFPGMDSAYWLRSYSHKLRPLPEDKQPHVRWNKIQIDFGHNGLDINAFPLLLLFCTLISWWCFFSLHSLLFSRPGATDSASSSSSSSSSFVNGATSKNLPAVQTVAPMPEDTMENMRSAL